MKQTLPEQLRLAADIEQAKLDGKPVDFEYRITDPRPTKFVAAQENEPLQYIQQGYEIRLAPLTFPDPPEGREWRNPGNHDAEWFGLYGDYRPLLVGESAEADKYEARRTDVDDSWDVQTSGHDCTDFHPRVAYRTRAPLPAPAPARVPLTAADVPPGSAFRWKGSLYWVSALHLASDGVWLATQSDGQLWHFNALMEKAEILRPGQIWQPCSKPEE